MPNWCQNSITLKIKDTEKVKRFLKQIESVFIAQDFNNYLIPRVEDFSENVHNWGTKWDIQPFSFSCDSIEENCLEVTMSFQTAWSPNLPVSKVFYDRLNDIGEVKYYLHDYAEGGHAFYGRFNGKVDDCREMNIMYYILDGSQTPLELENSENNILKFEEHDSLFIIKERSEEKMYYYNDDYMVKIYKCFSETFGENVIIYEYNNLFYSYHIY